MTFDQQLIAPFMFPAIPHEFKVTALRECPTPDSLTLCETPDVAASYWRSHITANAYFNPECECLAVLLLNTRRKIKGHHLVSFGTLDSLLIHPREIFRLAVVTSCSAIVMMHNHPSGDPTPSAADISATRDICKAGQILRIELLDHVIVGAGESFVSLRTQGYFQS